jgi:hypothetical protein
MKEISGFQRRRHRKTSQTSFWPEPEVSRQISDYALRFPYNWAVK